MLVHQVHGMQHIVFWADYDEQKVI